MTVVHKIQYVKLMSIYNKKFKHFRTQKSQLEDLIGGRGEGGGWILE